MAVVFRKRRSGRTSTSESSGSIRAPSVLPADRRRSRPDRPRGVPELQEGLHGPRPGRTLVRHHPPQPRLQLAPAAVDGPRLAQRPGERPLRGEQLEPRRGSGAELLLEAVVEPLEVGVAAEDGAHAGLARGREDLDLDAVKLFVEGERRRRRR